MIKTVLETVRDTVNLPSVARFSDDHITRFHMMPAYASVLERIRLSRSNPVVFRHSFTTVAQQESYILPPCISEIWRVAKINDNGDVIEELNPRGQWHVNGPGWSIQENMLSFRPFPGSAVEWDIWYVPSADATIHSGVGVVQGTDSKTIQLAATPELGHLDQRVNAYAGVLLRTINAGNAHEERVVRTYDQATRDAGVEVAFTNLPGEGANVTYELAPVGITGLWQAIAAVTSLHIGIAQNVSVKKITGLELLERRGLKSARDNISNIMGRYARHFDADTQDAAERTGGHSRWDW